ncbi:MAG: trypsin-like serine protease [Myxococcota bacterium]|nr:trypsin-like serine protease [Myxococcota bacterium]
MKLRAQSVFLFALIASLVLVACQEPSTVAVAVDPARRPNGIVGGTETGYNSWKGVVGLYYDVAGSLCTGTLIAPRIVLSAGHCVYYNGEQGSAFDARLHPSHLFILGGADLLGGSQILYSAAEQIVTHPQWTGDVSESGDSVDLSVILLEQPIEAVPYYKVRLSPEVETSQPGIIVGYGVTGWDETASAGIHRMGDTTILSIDGDMIEFGEPAGTCSGDSGGPLFTQQAGQWVLNGVASYVTNYCEPEWGHWNTSTVYYRDWIDQTVTELTGTGLEAPDTDTPTETAETDATVTETGQDTTLGTDTDTNANEEVECPWNTGYPCACASQGGTCADGSACIRWSDSEYGVCSKACGGQAQDPLCRLDDYGIAIYGGGLCVLRTGAPAASPDHCLVLCAYKDRTAPCPDDLVCRDLTGNGLGLCVPPSVENQDTDDSSDSEDEGEGQGQEDTLSDSEIEDEALTPAHGCGCSMLGSKGSGPNLFQVIFFAFAALVQK